MSETYVYFAPVHCPSTLKLQDCLEGKTKEISELLEGDSGCSCSSIQLIKPEIKGRAKQTIKAIATQRKIVGRFFPLVGYSQLEQISVPFAFRVPQTWQGSKDILSGQQ